MNESTSFFNGFIHSLQNCETIIRKSHFTILSYQSHKITIGQILKKLDTCIILILYKNTEQNNLLRSLIEKSYYVIGVFFNATINKRDTKLNDTKVV